MKKLFYLLLLLLPIIGFSQSPGLSTNTGYSSIYKAPLNSYVGSLYNVFSSSGGSGWTSGTLASDFPAQSVGASISSGAIITSLSGAGLFSDSLCFKDTMRSMNMKMVIGVSMTSTQTSTTYGVAVSLKGVNYFSHNSYGMYYNMSSTNNGHSQFFYQNQSNSSTWTQGWTPTASSVVSNSTNDRIILTFERIYNQYHWTVWNQTTNSATYDTTFIIPTTTVIPPPNTYMPTIWAVGGNLKIDSFTVVETDPTGVENMFVGDSKGIFGQTTFQQTYPAICGFFYGSAAIQQGFGDLTANIRSGWPDIKRIMPKNLIYEGGSNDIRFSQTSGTSANIKAIHDSCVSYGINFIVLSPMYESAQDNSPQLSIFSAYAPNYIYCWDITRRTNGLYTDGIHLSNQGAQMVARRIREFNALYNPSNRNFFVPNSNTPVTFY